ncbi:MAG TPA: PBP1A family penicillin-binding protein [Gammaproteobacteria bacterium]
MDRFVRLFVGFAAAFAACGVALIAVVAGGYYYVEPSLPNVEDLRDIRFQVPLQIYSRDGRLMDQFGEQKRTPVAFEEIPPILIQALLAAEDKTFFTHPGIDYLGTARAAFNVVVSGGSLDVPGASTITQQLAREYFLSKDVSLARKFREWILAFRIENAFTKQEILELFCNTFFFGQGSYGIAAAARTYFDKDLSELTLSDVAIIAGIPQRPSFANPYNGPELAASRRAYVLGQLRDADLITAAEEEEALAVPINSRRYGPERQLSAPYVAEMVRLEMLRRFGDAALTAGLKVTTTVDSRLQAAANESVRATLIDYDERHGYRGPLARIDLEAAGVLDESGTPNAARLREVLADYGQELNLETGIVIRADETSAEVFLISRGLASVGLPAVEWAAPYINDDVRGTAPAAVTDVLGAGDIVRWRTLADESLRLAQLPDVQGAFVALDPRDGAIVALVGGFDYFLSNYNRATQAARQPGSAFKPFVYSAALEHGFTPASIVNDAPLTLESAELEGVWRPENYTPVSHGEVRLREALNESMNQASIRALRDVGIGNAIRHLRKFGFDQQALPINLALALGVGGVSPLDLAKGYAVFANGGYSVEPYLIERIEDANGELLYPARPAGPHVVCVPLRAVDAAEEAQEGCAEPDPSSTVAPTEPPALAATIQELYPEIRRAPRVVSAQNIYLITDIMKDVVTSGSGRRASALGRRDIAGKTGTTNGPRDAWFAGFNADVVGTAWVGFDDDERPLGNGEQGGVTAIPMWIGFMAEALAGLPEHTLERPPGIVEQRINRKTGLIASDYNPNAIFEKFAVGHLPEREPDGPYRGVSEGSAAPSSGPAEPIF